MRHKVNRRRKNVKAGKKKNSKLFTTSLKGALRILGVSLVVGAGIFSLGLGFEKLSQLSVFKVQEIRWVGLHHLTDKKMDEKFDRLLGQNLFKLNIKTVHDRLLTHQWIKSATVKKEFPDTLVVIVVERKPASVEYEHDPQFGALVDFSTAPYLIDQEGVILQQGGPFPPGLPRLLNVNPESYSAALSIGHLVKAYRGAYIDLSDHKNLKVYFTDPEDGRKIGILHLGQKQLPEKWQQFLHIERDLKKRGFPTWEIDLQFSGKAIVKKGESGLSPDTFYF